ncbi:MAG: hypothetical protein NVSMB56_13180 [Pyrinomonadaceae bacterium]
MKQFGKIFAAAVFSIFALSVFEQHVFAQRSRTVTDHQTSANTNGTTNVPPAPASVQAKYEGGLIGYQHKLEGALSFDDINHRFIFRDKTNREIMSLPFDAVLAAYADTQSRRPLGATIASSIPAPYFMNLPALFIRKKYRYLTLQFRDPDTQTSGIASYEIKNKEDLAPVLTTLGHKAGLIQRGEAYVRKIPPPAETKTP